MPLELLDQRTTAHDQPGLGSAQQLVPAEGDETGAGAERLGHRRLVGQPEPPEVDQAAAAEVLDHGGSVLAAEHRQCVGRDCAREADDSVIARVHLQQHAGLGCERARIVRKPCLVGGADLDQTRAALVDDVRDPEGAANLDELAPRDHHFTASGEGAGREQHGGGVVVDHQGGLGSGKLAQQVRHRAMARAPPTCREVQLQVGIAVADLGYRGERRRGEWSPAEIGMQDDPGRVDRSPQAGVFPLSQTGPHALEDRLERD